MEPHEWYLDEWISIETRESLGHHHPSADPCESEMGWPSFGWPEYSLGSILVSESPEALEIDDEEDRRTIAASVGLESVPRRTQASVDEISGLLDSLVEEDDKVDVTQWIKSIRKRSVE